MSRNARFGIFIVYSLVAVMAPLMALLFPGQAPLQVNTNVIDLQGSTLPAPQRVLDSGAENYQQDVLNDLEGHQASVAADYPDGSSVLFARFESPFFAEKAEAGLKKMIPHVQEEEEDLWSVHFTSDSGEYVLLSRLAPFLVLIIADSEALAQQRLETLPALVFNPAPGVGAILAQRSTAELMMLSLFYVFLQSLLIANLKRWAGMPEKESS